MQFNWYLSNQNYIDARTQAYVVFSRKYTVLRGFYL